MTKYSLNWDTRSDERKRLSQWRAKIPNTIRNRWSKNLDKPFRAVTAIEALGQLKKDGHINSITVINAPPRTSSTIVTKVIAESPSLKLQGLPVFHEVLNDDDFVACWPDRQKPHISEIRKIAEVEGYLGSDVLVGKLIDLNVLYKKAADVVTKIMSHEFTGGNLHALLPIVDNVVSTVRHPAIHIGCIQKKTSQENEHDFDYGLHVHLPVMKYWKGFSDNMDIIDAYTSAHPATKHIAINGDAFLINPQIVTKNEICTMLGLQYAGRMLKQLSTPVYSARKDAWGQSEMAMTIFNPSACYKPPQDPLTALQFYQQETYDALKPIYEQIAARHPNISFRPQGLAPETGALAPQQG